MKKLFLFAVSALMILGSCTQDELVNAPLMGEDGKDVIVASIEGQPSTRMTEEEGVLSWEDDETFAVFGDTKETFTISNKSAGTFSGTIPNNAKYAVYYPADENSTITNDVLNINLASEYTSASSLKIPMWGTYEEGSILFKHLCAALKVSYNDIPDGYTNLLVEASSPIAGPFSVNLAPTIPDSDDPMAPSQPVNSDENPIIAVPSQMTAEHSSKVIVTITSGQEGVFYIPLPVGTYQSLKVSAIKGGGNSIVSEEKIILKEWSNLDIKRKGLYRTTATCVEVVDVTKPSDVTSLIETIDENSVVNITSQIDATVSQAGYIELPNVDATYNFTQTPITDSENPLKFTSDDIVDDPVYAKININMPENSEGIYASISTPNYTIALEGGTYESLTATTAENTLIIGEGVTIKKLIVKGGNVELKGNVGIIESEVSTTIKLMKDITDLTSAITISTGTTAIIDLNGYDIISTTDVFVVEGTLTINDDDNKGVVWASNDNSSVGCAVWAKGNGEVTINGGIYKVGHDGASKAANKANWRNDCIYVRDNASIKINGGEFMYTGEVDETNVQSDGHRFLLNCRDADYKAGTCSITVKGGTFHKFNPGATSSENPVTSYVAAGYSSVAGENDTYVVKEGILNETALHAAIKDGASITLGADINLTKAITIPVGITATINLNGYDITAPDTDAFEVAGTLTIDDENNEGVVTAGFNRPAASVCAVWANGGTVTINGGHYKVYSDADGKRNDCIYAGHNADNKNTAGTITINGGKFEYVWPDGDRNYTNIDYIGDQFLLNCANTDDSTTQITVNGGEFKNHVPSYEDTGRDGEVVLGSNKIVKNGTTPQRSSHHKDLGDVWYTVTNTSGVW